MELSDDAFLYIIDHVVFPNRLPDTGDDADAAKKDNSLLDYLAQSLESSSSLFDGVSRAAIDDAASMIRNLRDVLDDTGAIDEPRLAAAILKLSETGGTLPIPVRDQNAALIMRAEEDSIIIEAFELSPPNETIMSTQGRVARSFPGPAVAVPLDIFTVPEFRTIVVETISKMSHQEVAEMKPRARKAGKTPVETRDTTNPKLVTDFLMRFFESVGKAAEVDRIWKNTRDEILYRSSEQPWRRSAIWLLARVALQLKMSTRTKSDACYKACMNLFLSRILKDALSRRTSTELLHCMICKITQRLLKAGSSSNGQTWRVPVEKILSEAVSAMNQGWLQIADQTEARLDLSCLAKLKPRDDIEVVLPSLDGYLKFLENPPSNKQRANFSPRPTYQAQVAGPYTLPHIEFAGQKDDDLFVLGAFESWISCELDAWLASNIHRDHACLSLLAAMQSYHARALTAYSDNPESLSVMLLTTLELWVACDKAATVKVPMLLDYRPEIPERLLQSLILPLQSEITRLSRVEAHIIERQRKAISGHPSVFADFGHKLSFAVRFFKATPALSQLRQEIEAAATKTKEDKLAEFTTAKAKYNRLMKVYNTTECGTYTYQHRTYGYDITRHDKYCKRCAARDKAKPMTINVHEWPLPSIDLEVCATVFELDSPQSFRDWRNCTTFIMVDVLRFEYTAKQSAEHSLDHFLGQFNKTLAGRIGARSITKPSTGSHYKRLSIETTSEKDVCVNSGLKYQYHDTVAGCIMSPWRTTDRVANSCMYKLQNSASLQKFLYRPTSQPHGRQPNVVIASQHECPDHMSLAEFRAFASVPLGLDIQWANILLQVVSPSLDFRKLDTYLLILQTIHQAGPIGLRQHTDLAQEKFGRDLVTALKEAAQRIRDNWESSQALGSFVSIAARLLSFSQCGEVRVMCVEYLKDCRHIAIEWARLVRDKALHAADEDQRLELLLRAHEISLICTCTLDIDQEHVDEVLQVEDEAALFLECAIAIQETARVAFDKSSYAHLISLHRWKRLSLRTNATLRHGICNAGSTCLNKAIQQSWQGYRPGQGWNALGDDANGWVHTKTASSLELAPQQVHYNLLTGELLVDGSPLSRLPPAFETNKSYGVLFGRSLVEVVPARMPGMQFEALKKHHGYTLYFGMQTEKSNIELLVTCEKDGRSMSLIPSRLLANHLPHQFMQKYVHWYHVSDQTLEFRPIDKPWAEAESHWRLSKRGHRWVLEKETEDTALVPRGCRTAGEMTRVFQNVESDGFIHTTWHSATATIQVELPRLRLTFDLKPEGDALLLSRQFRGMWLAENTHTGTLIGLKSKLVLVNHRGEKMILVPDGKIEWSRLGEHVQVEVLKSSSKRVLPFHIDERLGRVIDNGDLYSMLKRAHLHALTAHCVPDKLTALTGTEQCLDILRSAAVGSFGRLKEEEVELLKAIASVSPTRVFYPPELRVMQTVAWSGKLATLAQHGELAEAANAILDQAQSLSFFHGSGNSTATRLSRGSDFLVRRDLIRTSTFRKSRFGAENHAKSFDAVYVSRPSQHHDEPRSQSAFVAALRIFQRSGSTQVSLDGDLASHVWKELVHSSEHTLGPQCPLECDKIMYDAQYLEGPMQLVAQYWFSFHAQLGANHDHRLGKFRIMMYLATLAYAVGSDAQTLQLLVALASESEVQKVAIPAFDQADLAKGTSPTYSNLESAIRSCCKEFEACPEYSHPALLDEEIEATWQRRERSFESSKTRAIDALANELVQQWPRQVPDRPTGHDIETYIDVGRVMANMVGRFQEWWDNRLFYQYLEQLERKMRLLPQNPLFAASLITAQPSRPKQAPRPLSNEASLLSGNPPAIPEGPLLIMSNTVSCGQSEAPRTDTRELEQFIDRLESQASHVSQQEYCQGLRQSLRSLAEKHSVLEYAGPESELRNHLQQHLLACQQHLSHINDAVGICHRGATQSQQDKEGRRALAYNSPSISPIFLLRQLSRENREGLSEPWKEAIVAYGLAITAVQHAERLCAAVGNPSELAKELGNTGHGNWKPIDYLDSLLVEIESGILIRDVQEEIAARMQYPPEGQNSVVQLHMGEGKSSVIVPISSAALADGTRLVVVIVAKPQSRQMHQMLVSKLGGLVSRQVYQMPVSRSLKLSESQVRTMSETYKKCMQTGGILLVQPEHLLSFKLMGTESVIAGRHSIARPLLEMQHFLDNNTRCIVDESDENFSVKFELVYTMGKQRSIEMGSQRWTLVQNILRAVLDLVPALLDKMPLAVEVEQGAPKNAFARLRLLDEDSLSLFQRLLADEICHRGLPGFPVWQLSPAVRDAFHVYITQLQLSNAQIDAVEGCNTFWTEATQGSTMFLRGLIAGGILAFVFGRKRWRVNYGLTSTREPATRLAVPYRAKDNPSPRSEFSHPDVVIVLTCLTYYYGGLEDDDLFIAFARLFKSDQADSIYAEWVRDCVELPASFRTRVGVNLKDRVQCKRVVFPHFRRSKEVIDYFLANVVFPMEMKEFPKKLSASGWDIGQVKPQPTTGFSGTSDSNHLLPLAMKYHNLPTQEHTNALVLQYLVQPGNTVQLMPRASEEDLSDADRLLRLIIGSSLPTQVILDVGSQILELTNIQLAKKWLKLTNEIETDRKEAVVFVNDDDELCVVDRKGNVELLQTSPYAKQLESCLVFLDEAHTRGIDLRLPTKYRAAVTLGASLTKDRLVQACMRMRKLGKGQTVVFYIPDEIQRKILESTEKTDPDSIKVPDVLHWSIQETFKDLRSSMPLWATQGARFERQSQIWEKSRRENTYELSEEAAKEFLEDEAMSLEARYRPRKENTTQQLVLPDLADCPSQVEIRRRCEKFDCFDFSSAQLQEEQERELSPEIEQERQVERPPKEEPHSHELHADLLAFVKTGAVPQQSKVFLSAFQTLKRTSSAKFFNLDHFPSSLRATEDFARTIKMGRNAAGVDAFERPVQWILTAFGAEGVVTTAVVISPFEANGLFKLCNENKPSRVVMHAYTPRISLAFRVLDRLDLYTVPSSLPDGWSMPAELRLQLNLFAGQLYFSSREEYIFACDYLNLAWERPNETDNGPVRAMQPDGFILPSEGDSTEDGAIGSVRRRFDKSPTIFLKTLFSRVRRDCEAIDRTHYGRLLSGALLHDLEEDLEEQEPN